MIITSYIINNITINLFYIITNLNKSPLLIKLLYFNKIHSKKLINNPNYFTITQIITLILTYKYIHNYIFKILTYNILL